LGNLCFWLTLWLLTAMWIGIFPFDFVALDNNVDWDIPIIFGRLYLDMGRALMNSEKHKIIFWSRMRASLSKLGDVIYCP
ncbi:hypothetical protein HAX54_039027, partial [Datura stramonium]|nr:hypothetical protein [Datura stramonium]